MRVPSLGSVDDFAAQIQRIEGYFPPGTPGYPNGSLAYRNNNPGNLRYTSYYAQSFGAVPGDGGYAKFPDFNTGWAALEHQITVDAGSGLTIQQMMNKYAPVSDNNDPVSYAQNIASALGVTPDTLVSSVIGDGNTAPVDSGDDGGSGSVDTVSIALIILGTILAGAVFYRIID